MSINPKLRKRVPAMLLSLIMVFSMIVPSLSLTAQAAAPQPLAAWNVANAASVSGTNADATSGVFQSGSTLQLIRDSVPYTVSYTSGGVQAGSGGASAASNMANMADNAWWVVNLSSSGYKDITVEWRMRSTNTGPRDFKVQYSTDGITWDDADNPAFQNTNNGTNQPIDSVYSDFTGIKGKTLPVGADDQSTLYIRWLMMSNESVNGSIVADSGTNTINNIVISGSSLSSGGGDPSDTTEINILTFNDFHGQVEFAGSNPGAARFTACMNYLLEQYPNSFAVAGGDNYQGSAVSNYYLGKPVSDMFKAMGVEYSSLGNHEFDWGYEKIPQFAADGNIEFVCSNLFYKGTDSRPDFVRPYVIREIDGMKIGIVGFIVTDTPVLVKAEYAEPFDFRAPGQWLADLVDSLKNDMGCDAVIALSHDGGTNLSDYGLACVVNGHSHAYQTTTVNGTAFVQAGYNGRAIGRLQLVFDNQSGACTVTPSYVMINTLPAGLSDAVVQDQIDWYLADSAGMFDAVVGQADITLFSQSVVNDWATRLVYDFIERQTGTPYVVIQNSGGWRNMSGLFMEQGDDITYRWLTVLMPFDNEIVLMDLPGNYLIDALNGTMAGGIGSPVTSPVIAGAYKQGSNWYLLDGTLIQLGGTYKVSCNDFMLTGGDSYDMFKYGTGVQFLGDKLRDALADQIAFRSGGVVSLLFDAESLTLQPGTDATAMNFNWYSDRADNAASVVQIAKKADMAGGEFPETGIITTTNGTVGDASADKSQHKAGVTALAPDTEYVYRVSNDGANFSKIYSFKTSSAGFFSFAVTGDPQLTVGNQDGTSERADETTLQGWVETMAAITARGVDFITGVGDQVDMTSNGSEAEYANFFAPEEMTSLPYAPAIGNHDRHYLFNYHYNLPNEQSFAPVINAGNVTNPQYQEMEVAGNYYYLYNNALFVVLNDSGYPESKEVASQYINLFDQTLKAATQAYAGQYDWLFVQHHKSTASVADHCADRDIQYYVEAGFERLIDEYSVDFVLAGHDHVYARSYPMYNGVPDKTGVTAPNNNPPISGGDGAINAINPNGTVYFTTTTASGLKYYELFNNAGNLYVKDNEFYPYLVDGKVGSAEYMNGNLPLSNAKYLQDKTPGYLYVGVNSDTVTFSYYNIGEYADTPYDAYTVTKQEKPINTVTVTGMNPGFEVGLAYNSPTWVKEPAKYGEAVVKFTVPNADDSYRIALNGRGYGDTDMLVLDNVRAGDTVDVSGYFYDIVIPDGWNSVYVNTYPYQWCVENANAGDTITLLKTMKSAAIYINGAEKKIDFVLDGSNPFAPTIVNASASAAIIKTSGSAHTLVIAVTEILSDGTTNTISAIFSVQGDAKGAYAVGVYQVYVAITDGKVTERYIVEETETPVVRVETVEIRQTITGGSYNFEAYTLPSVYKYEIVSRPDTAGGVATINAWNQFAFNPQAAPTNLSRAGEYTVEVKNADGTLAWIYKFIVTQSVTTPPAIVTLSSASNAKFVSIKETSNKIWTLTFAADMKYSNGTSKTVQYAINLSGNNANQGGKYKFESSHDLAGYTLVYDIKGNGSNIKEFKLTK